MSTLLETRGLEICRSLVFFFGGGVSVAACVCVGGVVGGWGGEVHEGSQ